MMKTIRILPLNFGLNIERGSCTMEYQSVIGQGHIEILPENENMMPFVY